MTTLVTEAEILPLCLFNLRVRLCSLVSRVGLEHINKEMQKTRPVGCHKYNLLLIN
jgi:hypothetical protein